MWHQKIVKNALNTLTGIEEEFYKSDRIIDVAVEKLEININPNADVRQVRPF